MRFPSPLIPATLIRRYKRFLADVELAGGERITVHCPNTGSMKGCADPGSRVMISRSNNPRRKYPHTLEMVRVKGFWVGINTSLSNRLVEEAIVNGTIPAFAGAEIRREVPFGQSRLDFLVSQNEKKTFIEVKNCTLADRGRAMFPDAVSERGRRHLSELIQAKREGFGAINLFCVQREDAESFQPAVEIDPQYAAALQEAATAGVTIAAWQARVSPDEIRIYRSLPVDLNPDMEQCDNCGRKMDGGDGAWQGQNFVCPECVDEEENCGCEDR